MQPVIIDYGSIQEPVVSVDEWEPPRHVFFGPKNPATGKKMLEPVYVHQKAPAMLYRKDGEQLRANIAQTESDIASMKAAGWTDDLASLGVVTAPSRDQLEAMAEAERQAARKPETLTLKKVPA